MEEFTSLITVYLTSESSATAYEFMADNFDFTPTANDDEGGASWNCDKIFVIDTPSHDTIRRFRVPRSAIVTLRTSGRAIMELGTHEVPARVQVVEQLQKSQLIVRCTMTKEPKFIPEWRGIFPESRVF